MLNFLHTFNPQPILFQLGWLKIHWYGVFIVLGIIVGFVVVLKLAKRSGIKTDECYNLGFYGIVFGLLGARIYAVFLDLSFYLNNPFEIIAVWHGGLAIHGAIIGGVITLLIYSFRGSQGFWQWIKKPTKVGSPIIFWQWADIIAPAIAIGQAIGRWGNYFNQELFGRPTALPWGIPIELANRPVEYLSAQYFQPTFFYESLLNLLNFAVLLFLFFWIKKRNQAGLSTSPFRLRSRASLETNKLAGWQAPGFVFLVYLINYSVIRILMEFLRLDPTPEIFGIRLPILVSLGVIGVSLVLLDKKARKQKGKEAIA